MKKISKKKKGFTLIELVAVLAILAILAAVLVPTVGGYITRSRKAAVITQCREVVNAVETYNLTAKTKIEDAATVKSLVGENQPLIKSNLIKSESVNKLGETMTVETAKKINKDEEALDNIEVDEQTHIFESYKEEKAE